MSNRGREYKVLRIPISPDQKQEREAILASETIRLRQFNAQIQDLKDRLANDMKATKKKIAEVVYDLENEYIEVKGEFISEVNELTRTMDYFDPIPLPDGSLRLVHSRPLERVELRQLHIDVRTAIAQN